jgi:hypothetical protein
VEVDGGLGQSKDAAEVGVLAHACLDEVNFA